MSGEEILSYSSKGMGTDKFIIFTGTVETFSLFIPGPSSVRWSRHKGSALGTFYQVPMASSLTFLGFSGDFYLGVAERDTKH